MMVRFATTCDHATRPTEDRDYRPLCGQRSREYEQWPTCSDCGDHVCPDHMQPGTLDEGDGERHDRCLCVRCHDEGDE